MRDIMNSLHLQPAISPVVVTDNTAQVSAIIDRSNYDALMFAINVGTLSDADATVAVAVDHGNQSNLSDAASVPAAMLNGTLALAGFKFDDDVETRKIGYVGDKKYVRITLTPANNTGNIPLSCVAILGHPYVGPTPNPPQ